jgi:hypothetical protein
MNKLSTSNRNLALCRRSRRLWVVLIAVALVATTIRHPGVASARPVSSENLVALQTAGAPFLQGTFQVVSNANGNQYNPHVDCDLASYTFDDFQGSSTIHYQNLSTGADNVIPGNQIDLLSDVSGSHIAFTQVEFTGNTIVVFDTITQTSTVVPGTGRSNPSIGANLVAFEDRSSLTVNESQVGTYDISTGTVTLLTSDPMDNRNISVSPSGNALVWEKCQLNDTGCDVYAAVQTSPGVFSIRALTADGGGYRSAHTDGELAVYISNRSGENDIYYQPLTGGTETHLSIPGDQRDPTISGNLIAFESQTGNGYDIFVYDLRSSQLFQVTNTAGQDESLSDLSVCNGLGRIIYDYLGNDFDVQAFTFQVPSTTEDSINNLLAVLNSFNLPPGNANSLIVKLQDALAANSASDTATICSDLTDFISECQAQAGKKLTTDQSAQLSSLATQLKTDLGCP